MSDHIQGYRIGVDRRTVIRHIIAQFINPCGGRGKNGAIRPILPIIAVAAKGDGTLPTLRRKIHAIARYGGLVACKAARLDTIPRCKGVGNGQCADGGRRRCSPCRAEHRPAAVYRAVCVVSLPCGISSAGFFADPAVEGGDQPIRCPCRKAAVACSTAMSRSCGCRADQIIAMLEHGVAVHTTSQCANPIY